MTCEASYFSVKSLIFCSVMLWRICLITCFGLGFSKSSCILTFGAVLSQFIFSSFHYRNLLNFWFSWFWLWFYFNFPFYVWFIVWDLVYTLLFVFWNSFAFFTFHYHWSLKICPFLFRWDDYLKFKGFFLSIALICSILVPGNQVQYEG